MSKRLIIFLLCVLSCVTYINAQENQPSELQQHAETDFKKGSFVSARYNYIRAYEEYIRKGQHQQGVECGVKATALYYRENLYKEAFELLRRIDQDINGMKGGSSARAALHYLTSKERMQMYMRLHKNESTREQLNNMERYANNSGDESVQNDLLYNKAVYFYSIGKNSDGNAVFKEMAVRLTKAKDYDKVDEVYQALIANGRKSGSASLVAQSYKSYIEWKDSVYALKKADEIDALKQQITDGEQAIAERDKQLSTRKTIIVSLSVLAIVLTAVLVLAFLALMRLIVVSRRLKTRLRMANENIALKAKFISNISAQLDPTLQKLDSLQPEVKALQDFSAHIQTLSVLETNAEKTVEEEDTQIAPFCETLAEEIRSRVRAGVTLKVDTPKISAPINHEFVSHILQHLLNNAAAYTPEGGSIWLDFKKRGPHAYQFIVSNTGERIPEEERENLFKPFVEIRDLTQGDGLGLPICRQMALNMNGDLTIDPAFAKGTRFILDLHS